MTYERLLAIIWTQPGGIVWVGVAIWITIHLGMFAFTAGMAPARNFGVPMDLSNPTLSELDVGHLRIGGAISDLQGELLIDPRVDSLLFATVEVDGSVTTELQPGSNPAASSRRTVAILRSEQSDTYAGDGVRLASPADSR